VSGQGLVDYAAPQTFRRTGDWLIVDLAAPKQPLLAEHPQSLSGVLSLGPGAVDWPLSPRRAPCHRAAP
jgi:hypothetical protein